MHIKNMNQASAHAKQLETRRSIISRLEAFEPNPDYNNIISPAHSDALHEIFKMSDKEDWSELSATFRAILRRHEARQLNALAELGVTGL